MYSEQETVQTDTTHSKEAGCEKVFRSDPELNTLVRIEYALAAAGIPIHSDAITNVFVCLKSKPLALLVGSAAEPKEAFVEILAAEIAGWSASRVQTMTGHAWWASRSGEIARFTHAQAVLNEQKIAALMDEAIRPGNGGEILIACLLRISPAELAGCFSVLAGLAEGRMAKPPPGGYHWPGRGYPPNLRVIGTLGARRFFGYDPALLAQTAVITDIFSQLPNPSSPPTVTGNGRGAGLGKPVRDENSAYRRLQQIPGWKTEWLKPALETAGALIKSGADLPSRQITSEILIYLANAWSRTGNGLFAQEDARNFKIALDQAMSQSILPRVWDRLRELPSMSRKVSELLTDQYPRSFQLFNQVMATR